VRLYVGSGIPGQPGRYRGLPASFDSRAFRRRVERLVGRVFPGATYFKTRGVWKGAGEDSLMVEVLASPVRESCRTIFRRAENVARVLARELGQEAVLVVATDSRGNVAQGFASAA
jgi:hypothetical protein